MTVSGSGRTREKDTRAPARGPFCVFGSSPAGRRASSCRAACCPSGSCLSVWMPAARRICGKPREISPSLSASPHGRAAARSLHSLRVDRSVWRSTATQPVQLHACTDRQSLSFFRCAGGVPAPLFPFDFYAGDSQQMLEQGSLVKYPSLCLSAASCPELFCAFYERVLRGVGEFEGARGSFLAQGKVPLAPSRT